MKYTVACLLLLLCYAAHSTAPRTDTGRINLAANEDVLGNRSLVQEPAREKEFHVRENDTTEYVLQLALDKAGRPLYYFMNIFTPVCYTGECKPVFINFYWDLLGNYIRYDLPPKEVLTKLDHKVFNGEDYQKLHDILGNATSLLADLKITDLIVPGTEKLTDSVDARTGATLKTIKNEVISGAVYTCYTLWHIVHGPVTDEMNRITETYNSNSLLHRFLSSQNYEYQYWALDKVMDEKGNIRKGFEADVRNIIGGKNVFIARYALQKAEPALFTGKKAQEWLWKTYNAGTYPLQIAMLKRMKDIPLQAPLISGLCAAIANTNAEQFRLMAALLQSAPSLPGKAYRQLADHLSGNGKAADIYRLLQQLKPEDNYVKTKMHDYENASKQTNG